VGRPIVETCWTPCSRQGVLPRRWSRSSVADERPPVV
jgi:hypothetical protein